MWNEKLVKYGGIAGVITAQCLIVTVVANASASLPTFKFENAETFLRQLYEARAIMAAYGWTGLLGIAFMIPFTLGLYEVLRTQGTIVMVGVAAMFGGMLAMGLSYVLTLVGTLDLATHFVGGAEGTRATTIILSSALWKANGIVQFAGGLSSFGVATLIFSILSLRTNEIPVWIGRMGIGAASLSVFWMGLLLPNSTMFVPFISINILANVIWMIALGLVMMREIETIPAPAPGLVPANRSL